MICPYSTIHELSRPQLLNKVQPTYLTEEETNRTVLYRSRLSRPNHRPMNRNRSSAMCSDSKIVASRIQIVSWHLRIRGVVRYQIKRSLKAFPPAKVENYKVLTSNVKVQERFTKRKVF